MEFNNTVYTYLHNLQVDIVDILDGSGTPVVEYKYDVWGKLLSAIGTLTDTLGKRSPFRYSGYLYDEESGVYYLLSRYYHPESCQFLTRDVLIGTWGSLFKHKWIFLCEK